jgi:hypothetical protein
MAERTCAAPNIGIDRFKAGRMTFGGRAGTLSHELSNNTNKRYFRYHRALSKSLAF